MFFGLYNPTTGVIRKCLSGPSVVWAALNAEVGELVIESGTEIDNTQQAVDVSANPHQLIDKPYEPTTHELQIIIVRAVQQSLDDFAQTRGYDSIMSAATYATSSVPNFAAEGRRAVDLRDATWAKLYELLDEVKAGTRPVPAGFEEIVGDLPTLGWS